LRLTLAAPKEGVDADSQWDAELERADTPEAGGGEAKRMAMEAAESVPPPFKQQLTRQERLYLEMRSRVTELLVNAAGWDRLIDLLSPHLRALHCIHQPSSKVGAGSCVECAD
jgi:hypothetical protein